MRVPPGYVIARKPRRFNPRQVDALIELFNSMFGAARTQNDYALVR